MENGAELWSSRHRILELASIIHERAKEIDQHPFGPALRSPSFGTNTASDLPPELHGAQHALLEASDELTYLVQGPREFLSTFAKEVLNEKQLQTSVKNCSLTIL